jgi:hypothetical protein
MKRNGSKVPTAVHGPLGIIYHPNEKANMTADLVENQFTSHDLCGENHERRVQTRVKAVFVSVDDTPLGIVRPCGINKLANSLKFGKFCGFDGIPNCCTRHVRVITQHYK